MHHDSLINAATSQFTTAFKNFSEYSMLDDEVKITDILKDIQLEEYNEKFTGAGICLLSFALLTKADLIDLGVRECHHEQLLQVIEIYAGIFEVDVTLFN